MNDEVARHNMVSQQVRAWQVLDEQVLAVLSAIAREQFVPDAFRHLAYSDTDIPLPEGQTMLSPKVVGRALQALHIRTHEKVLEIGTGTGYVTACIAKLAQLVVSAEIKPTLLAIAEKNLRAFPQKNIILEKADAVFGLEEYGPFDVIVATGSYPLGVPESLCAQLNNDGRLFAICGEGTAMEAVLVERKNSSTFVTTSLFETSVMPLIHAPVSSKFQF